MRRREREVTDPAEIEAILREATVCRLGLRWAEDVYVVPLSFGYEPGRLYFHGAPEGLKMELLRANPRACFEVDLVDGVRREGPPCSWGFRYRSVIGWGRVAVVENPEEKRRGLAAIVRQFGGDAGGASFPEKALAATAVLRLEIERMTAKRAG
ncbi:pyridoxamine 5'-phosphate oxidase family protein [Deferrisoma palaeochoriense]